jgi:hypothetical protein
MALLQSGTRIYGNVTIDTTATIGAGTVNSAPLILTTGTNLTSVAAGAVEYDGVNFYITPTIGTSEQRGVIPATQQFVLSTFGTAFGATVGNFFGTTSAIQLAASTTYSIEAYCRFSKTTAGTATINTAIQPIQQYEHHYY